MMRKSVKLSKERLDSEIRQIVKKVSHRPREEVALIVRERTGAAIDMDYLDNLLRGSK